MYAEHEVSIAQDRALTAIDRAGKSLRNGECNITDCFDADECVKHLSDIFNAYWPRPNGPDLEARRSAVIALLDDIEAEAAIKLAQQS